MNEVYAAFALIVFLYIFLAPIGLLIFSDYSTHNGFKADYKSAFLVVHFFSTAVVVITLIVLGFEWSVSVLLEMQP